MIDQWPHSGPKNLRSLSYSIVSRFYVLRAMFFLLGISHSKRGARSECEKHGMIRARFGIDNKVSKHALVEMFYFCQYFYVFYRS